MFTGIITDIGTIESIEKKGDWTLGLAAPPRLLERLDTGASVACAGVCLTVVARRENTFIVQVSKETLDKTTIGSWTVGGKINLERALKAGDELGGHIVSGHVDGVARVLLRRAEGDSLRFRFEVSETFAPFIAPKGSVALDGISLTVNEVEGPAFGVNIIPYTQTHTTIGQCVEGATLNFEVDPVARYAARALIYAPVK